MAWTGEYSEMAAIKTVVQSGGMPAPVYTSQVECKASSAFQSVSVVFQAAQGACLLGIGLQAWDVQSGA